MYANDTTDYSSFVTASSIDSETDDERVCPHCSKEYDDDGRARAAFLRHVADCEQDPQTRLWQFEGPDA